MTDFESWLVAREPTLQRLDGHLELATSPVPISGAGPGYVLGPGR
ncbi:hypothetical protein GCM10023350_20590 [Nocardioides endophyticus]|uniref:Uncharacterized protein n=1 Tax=Nocardioides endophyticus TaxID=1353775 RepID=A0ABP8YVR8_9ACTN